MFFDINDNLLPSAGQRVRLSVDYLDRGTGQFAIRYDAVGNNQKTAFTVTKTGSNTWKTASAIVTDWVFRNQGPNGSDLILVNLDSDDDIFHKLEVTKLANVQIGTVGMGTVSARTDAATYSPVVGNDFAESQRLELAVTPASGWRFTGWSGELTGTSARPFLFPTKDSRVTATFARTSAIPPNSVPLFSADPIGKSAASVNGVFSGSLSGNASDPNGQALTFSKVSGPSWLSIAADGTLSGTPQLADLGLNRWAVQVSSSGGTDTAILLIDVTAPGPNPPSGLSYSSPPVYTKGTVINNLSPSTSGGGVVRYAVTPKLPSGLSMNSITGLISGTPLAPTPATPYTITATNPDGSTTTSLNITVIDIAPSALTYSSNPATYRIDQAITLNAPTNSGGAVVSYAVTPALPAGLSLSTTTGIISGTPTALSTSANYTITATNTGGSTTAQLNIAVEEGGYRNTALITINDNAAASPYPSAIVVPATAGTITKVTVTIYGLTHARQSNLDILLVGPLGQTVLLMSDVGAGASVENANLTFDDAAAVSLTTDPVPITTGTYKPSNAVNPDSFTTPAPLGPYGSTLSVFNGTIPTGTWSLYVMDDQEKNTGSISGGWRLSLQTTAPPVAAPSALSYSSNPATYTKDTAIAINTPTSSGGAVVSYSVSPALPAGLTLNTSTGIISGTPTTLTAPSNYTITATNTGGSTEAWVSITVVSPYAAWSAQYGLLQAPEVDDDGDGNSNYFEFVAGLVPTNAGSVFKTSVSSVPGQPNQRAIVFSPIITGRTYTVKSSESLQSTTWIPLSGSISSDNGNERTVIDTTATEARKFYVIEIHYP
jgi:subtilisin-like proprotein convertase family protein